MATSTSASGLPPSPWCAITTAPTAAKLIWQSDTWPPKPVSGTSDSAMRAMPKILVVRRMSASLSSPARTAVHATRTVAVQRAVRHDGTGTSSRDADAERVRSCGFGSTRSTTNRTTTGITKRKVVR